MTTKRRAPGPWGHPLLGSLPEMQRDHLTLFVNAAREYGDVVRFRMGPKVLHLIVHPDQVQQVLMEKQSNYPKTRFNDKVKGFLGEGLLTSQGNFWRRQRRMVQPAFHRERLSGLSDLMVSLTLAMVERWHRYAQRGEPLDVAAEARRLTLEIIGKALFSTSMIADASAVDAAFKVALEHTTQRLSAPVDWPLWLSTPGNRRFRQALKTLDSVVYGIIQERRQSGADQGDLLSMLMLAQDEETGAVMSDVQIRDEIMTMFLAGYDSPSTAIAWTWYLISQHPQVEQNLEQELATVLGSRRPTFSDIPHLAYVRRVFDESLRLCAPAGNLGRDAIAADELGGYWIPAGSTVVINPYVTHRHPEVWPEPEAFRPERFLPEAVAQRSRFAYLPFGEGQRKCMGANFALMEAPLILATVAQRYRLRLVPNHPTLLEPMMTYRPRYGIQMTIHPRQATG